MQLPFSGKWRGTVTGRNAGFQQRVVVSGAASGNGAHNGVVGNSFVFEDGQAELQWNDGAGSGWQASGIISSIGMTSPLVVVQFVGADDNVPAERDGDFDDLQVRFEHLDAPFEVVQRPFALERGSLTMMPDGIFDTSQGVQYMGVRIRNTWFFDWESAFPATGMKIGIAPASRTSLTAQGVIVRDDWSALEQQALGQTVDAGYVRVPDLRVGEETTIYFKVDVTNANPSKPQIGFVAQRDAFDPNFDAPTRVVQKKIFISRSSYDKTAREVVAEVPEGTLRLKLQSIILDRRTADRAAKELRRCLRSGGGSGGSGGGGGGGGKDDWWEDCRRRERFCREHGSDALRGMLQAVLGGKDIDICKLKELLELCCEKKGHGCDCGGGGTGGGQRPPESFPGGGWQDGTGLDGWCRVRPIAWLPVAFEYKIEPNPAFTGQLGPLAFEDPWWKVILLIIAILLALASLIYDYVMASEDPKFIIGQMLRLGDPATTGVDGAVCNLNGSRGVDLGELDAQGDDRNNGLPIQGLDTIVQLNRGDNGDNGLQDAVLGSVVWKSGGTSGTTRGFVSATNVATSIPYDEQDTISGTISFTNQVLVAQIVGSEQPLSQGGDSGSVWVDLGTGRAVALNFAGPVDDSGTTGTANPIRQVADQLNIRFNP
jgi:hypothetical protein